MAVVVQRTSYTGWRCNNGKLIASKIEDHSLVPYKSGGYLIIYEKELEAISSSTCDVRIDTECNSGVFFCVGNPRDPVQTGFEVQVASEIGTDYHDFGAIYDLVPKSSASPCRPTGTGHRDLQGAQDQRRGQRRTSCRTQLRRMDHASSKSGRPPQQVCQGREGLPAKGYVGLQDHGHKVWFKNVKLLDLAGK